MSEGAISDDDGSFESAFDQLFRVAYVAAYKIVRSREDSEDIAIDALARGSVKWKSIQGHSEAWITTVSVNLAIDELRRRKRSVELVKAIAPESSPIERIDLLDAIGRLPRRQRMTISLRYLSGLSEKETAQALGCATGTVKQHTSRGIARLRKSLTSESILIAES
jgi:RNA polymerase sigma factor (sigma-70 family)